MIITFASTKGGVGKTTTAILTANNIAARGKRVLVLDMDPANNSSTMYYTSDIQDIENIILTHNTFEALAHRKTSGYIVKSRVKNIDIIPSSVNLFDLRTCPYNILQKTLADATDYDYIIIDTAPTYDNLIISALKTADLILTPIEFTSYAYGAAHFLKGKLYDELPEKIEERRWWLVYTHWQESLKRFDTAIQTQISAQFDAAFDNIADIHIPQTPAAVKYTQTYERVSTRSNVIGNQRLAKEVNKLVNMITGEDINIERF